MPECDTRTRTVSEVRPISILFLCLARDCEDTVSVFFSYLDRLADFGFSCAGIVGENGSRDRTRALIQQAAGKRIELFDTAFMAGASNRLARMAIGRQGLLDRAKQRGLMEEFVCVADLDNVMIAPPEPTGLRTAAERLRTDDTLFAVGATSSPVYYDLLSLRAPGHDYSHFNAELMEAQKRPLSYFQFHQQHMYRNQRLMTRPEPIPCASSFNGFCLYVAKDYQLGSYRAGNESEVCEHANLNLSIGRTTGKTMLIAPELVIRTPADHGPVGFFRFWSDRIRKKFNSRTPRPSGMPQVAGHFSFQANSGHPPAPGR